MKLDKYIKEIEKDTINEEKAYILTATAFGKKNQNVSKPLPKADCVRLQKSLEKDMETSKKYGTGEYANMFTNFKIVPAGEMVKEEHIDEAWQEMPEGGRLKTVEFSVKLSKMIEKEIKDFIKKEGLPDRSKNVIQGKIQFFFEKPGFRSTAVKKEKDLIAKGM